MDDDIKFHQTWHLQQLPSFYQQFLFIFYSVYKNKPRGVTVRQLVKFIKRNYYLDGDLCHQMITALRQAIDQGEIEERCEKYHLVGPIASVQNTAPNSPERVNELRNVCGIFNFNSTQRKPRSKRSDRDKKTLEIKKSNNSEGTPKRERIANAPAIIKSGSREKCSSVGLALQEKNVMDALQTRPDRKIPDNNSVITSSRFVPNITVLSKIKQYFETTVCKCQSRTSSKSKSKTKSSLNKLSSDSTSSLSMKTATQNSNHTNNDKEISLKSHHDNSTDEYLSFHSKSDKLKKCNSNSQNSKSPKLRDSSQGISLQATRSKTPTQYTLIPGQKLSDVRSSASNYSNDNNKTALSFVPIISTFQHFLGCKGCNGTKKQVPPSTRTLRPRTVTSRNSLCRNNLSLKKQQLRKKLPKRLNVKFRTIGRNRCNGQFCSLRRKCNICRPCKIRFPRPSTVNSSRPLSKNTYTANSSRLFSNNTYTATRSMRTRSSTRGPCPSALSSTLGSLGRSSISLKSARPLKPGKKRKKSAISFKMPIYKRRKLKSRDLSLGESYWGDFCCT